MSYHIFAINPGSTSIKIGLYVDNQFIYEHAERFGDKWSLGHSPHEKALIARDWIAQITASQNIDLSQVDAFVGRGGMLGPLEGGTYIVTPRMLETVQTLMPRWHVCNLGAVIAHMFAEQYHKPAYIVNPPHIDELMPEARPTGLPGIERYSASHALSQKECAFIYAEEHGKHISEVNLIVAHMGGGISIGAHQKGRMIDTTNGTGEGPMTPERSGLLPNDLLTDLCYSGKYTHEQMRQLLYGGSGLKSYFGTADCRVLVERAKSEPQVKLILDAMIYQIARNICATAAALCGQIDAVVLTGGLAYSDYIVQGISKRTSFLAPIVVYPGEYELQGLAKGALRVLNGSEIAKPY